VRSDARVAGFLSKLLAKEVIPVVPAVPGVDLHAYQASVMHRFANRAVADTIRRLCLDGSNRQPKFILPSAADRLKAGQGVAGLALFAYPLYAPGKPEQRRDAHLASIVVPTLFASGTRDTFGTPEELAEAAALVDGARVQVLDGADHGFSVLKASGRSREEVWAEATAALLAFIDAVLP